MCPVQLHIKSRSYLHLVIFSVFLSSFLCKPDKGIPSGELIKKINIKVRSGVQIRCQDWGGTKK